MIVIKNPNNNVREDVKKKKLTSDISLFLSFYRCLPWTRFSLSLLPKNVPNVTSFYQCKFLHTTLSRKGLEEFFDDPKNWGEEKVKSGEIFGLVVDSMDALDKVVQEREDALRLLQTGQEKARPGAWRRDIFGRVIWHKFKQWPIPWYLNKKYNRKRFFAMPYVDHFLRLRLEKQARLKARKQSLEKKKEKRLQEKFPHLAEAQKSSSV
ncbi:mitochondrial ribosomal protein L47 [Ictidomys tridecemlineatus]|nr:mitochondrial ribosomal protein L47 [Ictidomys tridecemlineatus]